MYSYFDRLNDRDYYGYANLSLAYFLDPANLSLFVNNTKEYFEKWSYYHYSIENLEVLKLDDFNTSERTELESHINELADEYEVIIDDYALLLFTDVANLNGLLVQWDWLLISLKVNSLWYIETWFTQ